MQTFTNVFTWITGLGGEGIMLIALFILGMVFKLGIGKALRSGLTSALGFVGLNLVVGMLIAVMGPATSAIVERFGWHLNVVDVGWGLIGMSWGSPVAGFIIITAIVLNLILLFVGFTKTLMIDFWNYWSFCAAGALAYGATENVWFSVLVAAIYMVISWKVADIVAPNYQEFYGMPGVSWPTGAVIPTAIIGIPMVKLIQKIPFIKDINADPEHIQEKYGVLGEPVIVGAFLGALIGFLAGFGAQQIIIMSIKMAGVLVLTPRMIAVLMEGLLPISNAASEFTQKYMSGRQVWIGIDASTILGHPATLSSILILTPIVTFMSLIPGNQMLAIASLVAIPWFVIPMTSYAKGNVLHIVLACIVIFAVYFWCATALSPAHTNLAIITGFDLPEGAKQIGSLSEGGNPITWLLITIGKMLGL
ncbi:MAG: hypothetical protein HGA49_06790 [Eubacteriaceae bacterium]|nr:hypothetical protein [Eubacteriaceae bacterium]